MLKDVYHPGVHNQLILFSFLTRIHEKLRRIEETLKKETCIMIPLYTKYIKRTMKEKEKVILHLRNSRPQKRNK